MNDDLFSTSTRPVRTRKSKPESKKKDFWSSNTTTKKEKRKRIAIIAVVILVLISSVAFGIYKYIDRFKTPAKTYIIEAVKKTNILDNLNIDNLIKFTDNLNTKNYEFGADARLEENKTTKAEDILENNKTVENEDISKSNSRNPKIELSELYFAFNGKIDNTNKSSELNTNIKWEDINFVDWVTHENQDIISITSTDYFNESIGINKDNIDKVLNEAGSGTNLRHIFTGLINSSNQNIFDEIKLLDETIKKSFIESLTEMPEEKFEVERDIPTIYKDKKQKADNYIVNIDKITLDRINSKLDQNLNTALHLDANRFKIFSSNKEDFLSLLELFKLKLGEGESLKVTIYRIGNESPKITADIVKGGDAKTVLDVELKFEGNNNEVVAKLGNTNFKFVVNKDKGVLWNTLEAKFPKNYLNTVIQNEIKIDNPEKTTEIQAETLPRNSVKIVMAEGPSLDINFDTSNEVESDVQNNEQTENQVQPNIGDALQRAQVDPSQEQNLEEKPFEITDSNEKFEENIEYVNLKIEFDIPENIEASNMDTSFKIFTDLINIKLNINIKFVDIVGVDMPTNITYLDGMKKQELKTLFDRVIMPTIIQNTANKVQEIMRIKSSMQTNTSNPNQINIDGNQNERNNDIDSDANQINIPDDEPGTIAIDIN